MEDEKKYTKESIKNSILMIITLISSVASILSVFGIQIPLKLGIIILTFVLSITYLILIHKSIYNLNKKNTELKNELKNIISTSQDNMEMDVKILENIENIEYDSLTEENINEIMIIASGTETYYNILVHLLKKVNVKKSLSVTILFRKGYDKKREGKLLQYDEKWNDLKIKYNLDLKFCYVNDFECSLRGILLNRQIGYIGFYHRISGKTIGVEEEVLYVNRNQEIGCYIIQNFITCFQDKKYFSNIRDIFQDAYKISII